MNSCPNFNLHMHMEGPKVPRYHHRHSELTNTPRTQYYWATRLLWPGVWATSENGRGMATSKVERGISGHSSSSTISLEESS